MSKRERWIAAGLIAALVVISALFIAILLHNRPKRLVSNPQQSSERALRLPMSKSSESSVSVSISASASKEESAKESTPKEKGVQLPKHSIASSALTPAQKTFTVTPKNVTFRVEKPKEPIHLVVRPTNPKPDKKEPPKESKDPAPVESSTAQASESSAPQSSEHVSSSTGGTSSEESGKESVPVDSSAPSSAPADPAKPEDPPTKPENPSGVKVAAYAERFEAMQEKNRFEAYQIPYSAAPLGVQYYPQSETYFDLRQSEALNTHLWIQEQNGGFYIVDRHVLGLLALQGEELQKKMDERAIPGGLFAQPMSVEDTKKQTGGEVVMSQDGNLERCLYVSVPTPLSPEQEGVMKAFNTPILHASDLSSIVFFSPVQPSTITNPKDVWPEWVKQWMADTAGFEWAHHLPLYASSKNYEWEGKDIRTSLVAPQSVVPSYGVYDFDGDGQVEYLLRLHAFGQKDSVPPVDGYWAIYGQGSDGLFPLAFSNHGNGEMLRAENEVAFLSMKQDDAGDRTISLETMPFPNYENKQNVVQLPWRLLDYKSYTGEALAQEYPNATLLLSGEQVFLVQNAVDAEAFFATLGKWQSAKHLAMPESNPNNLDPKLPVKEEALDTPIRDVVSSWFEVPLQVDSWNKSIPIEKISQIKESLTLEKLQSLEP